MATKAPTTIAVCQVHGWWWQTNSYGVQRCPEPGCGARVDSYVYARSYEPDADALREERR